jgi:hypothetical protein
MGQTIYISVTDPVIQAPLHLLGSIINDISNLSLNIQFKNQCTNVPVVTAPDTML